MRRNLFNTILEKVCVHDSYFVQERDVCGLIGLSSRQKITATFCMVSLGVCADVMDDYCRTSESNVMECIKRSRQSFKTITWDNLRGPTLRQRYWLMYNADFLVCLSRWIVYIISGKIVQWYDKAILEIGTAKAPSFLKSLQVRNYTYSICFLGSPALIIISMFLISRH